MLLKGIPLLGLLSLSLLWPLAQEKDKAKEIGNPLGKDKVAIAAGRQQFEPTCGRCHGTTGKGGRGPKLADMARIRSMPDKPMFDVIKEGIKGTQMPPFPLPDTQIWQLVSFIRSLNATAIDQDVPGDKAAGETFFFGKGQCSKCHMMRGRGGLLGPDLSNLGASRSAEKIEESIKEPSAFIETGFSGVSVVTRDGCRVSGVAKNNSNYSIQILDAEGNYYLFLKSELKELIQHKKSLMPARALSERELQDLLAFLSRQTTDSPPQPSQRPEHGKE
jgi:cytochrome c oxidase cbb3-type subunit 3